MAIVAPSLIWPPPNRSARSPKDPPVAVTTVTRKVSAQGLVSFRGNTYSVPPAHAGQQLTVTQRLGSAVLTIATLNGVTVAVHTRRPDGAGACVRTEVHVTALNTAALGAFTTAAPHRSKRRIPPGPDARHAAAVLRGDTPAQTGSVIDLTRYAEAAARRRTLH